MKSTEEIRQIVLDLYKNNLSEDKKYITIAKYPIGVDMVVGYVEGLAYEDDKYIHTSISMAMEYFMH